MKYNKIHAAIKQNICLLQCLASTIFMRHNFCSQSHCVTCWSVTWTVPSKSTDLLHTHTHTALWILSGTTRVSRYQKEHSPTHTYRGHQLCHVYYDPWHPPCSIYVPADLFPQSLSKFSLVYIQAWHLPYSIHFSVDLVHYALRHATERHYHQQIQIQYQFITSQLVERNRSIKPLHFVEALQ